jgi:hypothetical protein
MGATDGPISCALTFLERACSRRARDVCVVLNRGATKENFCENSSRRLTRLAGKTAAETISVMLAVFARVEPPLRKSITFDNDTAFAQHALLRTMPHRFAGGAEGADLLSSTQERRPRCLVGAAGVQTRSPIDARTGRDGDIDEAGIAQIF